MVKIQPFGSWKSPITAETITAKTVGLGGVASVGKDIYWLEARPEEKGRNVLVKKSFEGTVTDITPQPFNVRTRVHEYGGGAYLITSEVIYFSNYSDGRIYQQIGQQTPVALTPESARRYTDFILDITRNRLICICEDHGNSDREPSNSIVAVGLETGEVTPLATGNDFYASPKISPDGTKLAYITWNHPDMP